MLLEVGLRVTDDPIIRGRRVWGDFFQSSPTLWPLSYHTTEVEWLPQFTSEEETATRQHRIEWYLILCKRANLAKSCGWDKRERQKGCMIKKKKVWDPGVLSGVWVVECGLSNDQSTPSLLPWHLLVLQWPPVWVWAHRELNTQPESNQTAQPTKLGSRSNSDILQNVNVQPFLKVLLHGSFALRIQRVEMGRGESQWGKDWTSQCCLRDLQQRRKQIDN